MTLSPLEETTVSRDRARRWIRFTLRRARCVVSRSGRLWRSSTPSPPIRNGPPASELTVTLLAPNGGEMLEPAVESTIRWSALAAAATVELALVDQAGATSQIATDLASPAGQEGSFTWTPAGVAAPTRYKMRVTITDAAGGVAVDDSDAELTISPPTTGVSLAADLGPMFATRCNSGFCHNTMNQASALDLTPAKAHAQLVGVPSERTPRAWRSIAWCRARPRPASCIFKLQGNGACFAGVRMPKGMRALSAAQLQQVRDWITEGAKNN